MQQQHSLAKAFLRHSALPSFVTAFAHLSPTAMADNREPWLQHIITNMGNFLISNFLLIGSTELNIKGAPRALKQ